MALNILKKVHATLNYILYKIIIVFLDQKYALAYQKNTALVKFLIP